MQAFSPASAPPLRRKDMMNELQDEVKMSLECNQVSTWQSRSLCWRLFECGSMPMHPPWSLFYHKFLLVPASHTCSIYNYILSTVFTSKTDQPTRVCSLSSSPSGFRMDSEDLESRLREKSGGIAMENEVPPRWESKSGTTVHRLCTK